jgi:hypothetical protein
MNCIDHTLSVIVYLLCLLQSEDMANRLELAGNTVTILFMIEMGLKLLGLGCSGYWADGWNQLDGTIVIASAFDLGSALFASEGSAFNVTTLTAD